MEETPPGAGKRESNISIVDRGWNLVSQNTELIFIIALGFVAIIAEVVGYWPIMQINDLVPPLPYLPDRTDNETQTNNTTESNNITETNNTEQTDRTYFAFSYKISQGLELMGAYTVYIALVTHILLVYPVITERRKLLLVPWLLVTLLRSVLRELTISILGILVCSSHDVFLNSCLQYSALQGARLCVILYLWTSVHSFYYFLKKKQSAADRSSSVINTIRNSSDLYESSLSITESMRQSVEHVLSGDMDDDDESTDALLVERAAMAWIAREILENDGDYVTDKQFSQYLVVKATMELRQALKELADKKKKRKPKRKLTAKERIEESLEFMKCPAKDLPRPPGRLKSPSRTQAFEMGGSLSRRDPIRRIRPLTSLGKPVSSEMSLFSRVTLLSDATVVSTDTVDSETQTEPPTYQMAELLDILEYQQQRRISMKTISSQHSF